MSIQKNKIDENKDVKILNDIESYNRILKLKKLGYLIKIIILKNGDQLILKKLII